MVTCAEGGPLLLSLCSVLMLPYTPPRRQPVWPGARAESSLATVWNGLARLPLPAVSEPPGAATRSQLTVTAGGLLSPCAGGSGDLGAIFSAGVDRKSTRLNSS